jgi:TP901 family phage tail tape measure protein
MVDQATKPMQEMGKRMQSMGTSMMAVGGMMSLPLLMFGKNVLDTANQFQQSMNAVAAVSGITADRTNQSFESMRKLALELGATTQFSANQAADGMKFLGMAGLSTDQILKAIPKTLQLAAAGNLTLAEAADISTNVMSALGLKVEELGRVNDVFALTASRANTDVRELAEAFRPVASMAPSLGVNMEQLAAMLGAMANAGEKGSIAGTLLRNALMAISVPSDKARAVFGKLNININDFMDSATGKVTNVTGLVSALKNAEASAGDLQDIFGQRGMRAIAIMMRDGGKGVDTLREMLENADGSAQKMAETMMKGLPGALKLLESAWEGVKLAITDSGIGGMFEWFIRGLADFLSWLTKTNPMVLRVISLIASLVAIAGVLVGVIGAVTFALGLMAANPIVLIIAGIIAAVIALVAAFAWLRANWDEIMTYLGEKASAFGNWMLGIWENIKNGLMSAGQAIWEGMKAIGRGVMTALLAPINLLITGVVNLLNIASKIPGVGDKFKLAADTVSSFQRRMNKATGATNVAENLKIAGTSKSQTDVNIRVQAGDGSSATVNGMRKRGDSNVKVNTRSPLLGGVH